VSAFIHRSKAGEKPFYHIIQSFSIEGSAVLKGIHSVGEIDSSIEICVTGYERTGAAKADSNIVHEQLPRSDSL
jgi:hypothetical protein